MGESPGLLDTTIGVHAFLGDSQGSAVGHWNFEISILFLLGHGTHLLQQPFYPFDPNTLYNIIS